MRILPSRSALALATITLAGSASALVTLAPVAEAHGSTEFPISRIYGCYREGPENPRSAACRAAIKASGTQPFYDWNGLRIGDAAGRHRQLIPDGKLCSAGNAAYRGLDLPRQDWKSTAVRSGQRLRMSFYATAPHKGSFEVYITRAGYRPTALLRWADLTRVYRGSPLVDPTGHYTMTLTLPTRTGPQVLYTIWQRSDSPEAFYACSDLRFSTQAAAATDGTTAPAGAVPTAPAPPTTSSARLSTRSAAAPGAAAMTSPDPATAPATSPSPVAAQLTAPRLARVSAHPERSGPGRAVLICGVTIVVGLLFGAVISTVVQTKIHRPARRLG